MEEKFIIYNNTLSLCDALEPQKKKNSRCIDIFKESTKPKEPVKNGKINTTS